MSTIKTSELNLLSEVDLTDFCIIVDSGSLTTFRTPLSIISNWIGSYASSSITFNAISALNSISSSYSTYTTNSLYLIYPQTIPSTSSYAITSSNTLTASFIINNNLNIANSNYAITTSYALFSPSASYKTSPSSAFSVSSISASNVISASYAITASTNVSSSYGVSSSNAFTSSYAENIPIIALNIVPLFTKNLNIRPTELFSGLSMTITSAEIILWDGTSKYIKLQDVNINAELTPTSYDKWYDLYLIYNEITNTISTVYSTELLTPKSSLLNISSYLPSNFTYYKLVGSIYPILYTSTYEFVERYMEYGNRTKFTYRTAMNSNYTKNSIPTTYLISTGNMEHYLGNYPLKTQLKFIKWDNSVSSDGWRQGDVISHDQYNFFTQVYMERAQVDGYEDFPAYLIYCPNSSTINIKYTELNSDQDTFYFDAYGHRANLWSNVSPGWVAMLTLESNGYSI